MSQIATTARVGDIVAHDARTANVFHRHGIDFCCDGRLTLAEACATHGLDPAALAAELEDVHCAPGAPPDPTTQPIPALIDHIVATHHSYVRDQAGILSGYLAKLAAKHAATHPELPRAAGVFSELTRHLAVHMDTEERVLFPYMRALDEASRGGSAVSLASFGSLTGQIRMMEEEHRYAAAALAQLRTITAGFAVPIAGCATWKASYAGLAAFERDVQQHAHLENNVLFPAALTLEQRLVVHGCMEGSPGG